MLSVLDCYNHAILHKQHVAKEIVSRIPGFDPNNPEHRQTFDLTIAQNTIDLGLYTLNGESLLSRGRNHIAQQALTQGWDKLFFIDADEGFSWAQLVAIATSPYPIAAGLVPLKTYPKFPHTFETSLNYLPFQDDEKYFDNALRTLSSTIKMAQGHGSPWVEVAFTGTGFLCIDVSVLAKLAETAEEYIYPNPHTGNPETHWSFFDGGPINNIYMSEDWSFVEKCRNAGYKCMINTDVRVSHTGPHTFMAG